MNGRKARALRNIANLISKDLKETEYTDISRMVYAYRPDAKGNSILQPTVKKQRVLTDCLRRRYRIMKKLYTRHGSNFLMGPNRPTWEDSNA